MTAGGVAVETVGAPLRMFNAVAQRVPRLRPELPCASAALADAVRSGAPAEVDAWRAGLTAFVSALHGEADLTPAGRHFARGVLENGVRNLREVRQVITEDPAITRNPVGEALVVVGLPRSGTTLLQHLLALAPGTRSLLHWQAARPAPPPGQDAVADRERIRSAERAIWLVDRLLPYARTLHPTGPHLPTECVTLFANSFASLELGVLYQVPSYVRWCLQTDMRPHYEIFVQQLQVLGHHGDQGRWVLKSPSHLFWLEELGRALPAARFVVLHRDPLEVMPSFCRLATVAAGATTRRVDRVGIGRLWSEAWAEAVRRSAVARAHVPADRWIDVRYRDLVADPVRTVAGIHEAFGIDFDDRLARAVRAHVTAHPARSVGPAPRLEDFGLDARTERRRFDEAAGGPAPLPGRR